MVEIAPVSGPEDLSVVRELFREYERSIGIDLEYQGFSVELASLPGTYAPPHGALLLAQDGDQVIGCVAVRRLNDRVCEMKRLYVRPGHRGSGAGVKLVQSVIEAGRQLGYEELWLDTLATMTRAHALYASLGFREIAPYGEKYAEGSKFFGLELPG